MGCLKSLKEPKGGEGPHHCPFSQINNEALREWESA